MDNKVLIVGIIVIALVIGGFILFSGDLSTTETGDRGDVAATVDGRDITFEDLNQQAEILGVNLEGLDSDQRKEIERNILDQLISERLILQDAESAGVTIDEDEVDQRISQLALQFGGEEALEQEMDQAGITAESLRRNIRNNLIIDIHIRNLTADFDVTASEEEIQGTFEEWQMQAAELGDPSLEGLELEDLRENIVAQIEQEKMTPYVLEIMEELRQEAEIEIFI